MKHVYVMSLELREDVPCHGRRSAWHDLYFDEWIDAVSYAFCILGKHLSDIVDRPEGWDCVIRERIIPKINTDELAGGHVVFQGQSIPITKAHNTSWPPPWACPTGCWKMPLDGEQAFTESIDLEPDFRLKP